MRTGNEGPRWRGSTRKHTSHLLPDSHRFDDDVPAEEERWSAPRRLRAGKVRYSARSSSKAGSSQSSNTLPISVVWTRFVSMQNQ